MINKIGKDIRPEYHQILKSLHFKPSHIHTDSILYQEKKKRPSFSEWRKLRNVSTVSRQPESTYHPHKHYIEYWQLWSGVQGCQIAATGRSHSTANISEYEQFSNLIKMSCFDNWLTFKKYGQKSGRFNWECFLFWGW